MITKQISITIILVLTGIQSLFADIVFFKDGKILENVKTKVKKEEIVVEYADKTKKSFAKTLLKSIKLKIVIPLPPVVEIAKIEVKKETKKKKSKKDLEKELELEKEKELALEKEIELAKAKEIEKERIRLADALLEATDWEISPEKKLNFAILNFKAGEGVSKEELNTITELITTNLVRTKLFIILDRDTLNKALNAKGGEGCADDLTKCTESASSIAKTLKAAKILTGSVNKIEEKYYISGNIIDTEGNNIDFAETSVADSKDTFPLTAEYFSKKVAGGIMEFWDTEIQLKEGIANLKYIWRSAIFPGWGQYSYGVDKSLNYSKWKGVGFASVFSLSLFQFYNSYLSLKKEESSYTNFHNLFLVYPRGNPIEQVLFVEDGRRNEALQNSAQDLNRQVFTLGFIYMFNMLDIFFPEKYFLGLGTPNKSSEKISLQVFPEKSNSVIPMQQERSPYIIVSYQWRF